MTLTFANNDQIDIAQINYVQAQKVLGWTEAGRLTVTGWNVIAWMGSGKTRIKKQLASYGPTGQGQAVALAQLLNDMTIHNTIN